MLFAHGSGGTSKSTIIGTVQHALGDYCATADFESFLRRRGDAPIRTNIARLVGKRMVVSIEVDDGRRLAEGLIKTLSGGDGVTARHLYGREFEFRPAFVLWLCANRRPGATASDDALWRRIVQVPLTSIIPEHERDPTLRHKLRTDESTRGILAWIVRGAVEYYQRGLDPPERVINYTLVSTAPRWTTSPTSSRTAAHSAPTTGPTPAASHVIRTLVRAERRDSRRPTSLGSCTQRPRLHPRPTHQRKQRPNLARSRNQGRQRRPASTRFPVRPGLSAKFLTRAGERRLYESPVTTGHRSPATTPGQHALERAGCGLAKLGREPTA